MKVICIADFAFDPIQSMLHQLFRLERFLPDLPLLIDHNFLVFSFTILTLFCSKSKKNANHFVLSLSTLSQDLFPPPPIIMNIRKVYSRNITPWHCAVLIQQQKKGLGFYHRWVPTFAVCVCHMPDDCFASMKLVSWNYLRFLSGFTNALSTYWYWMLFFIKKNIVIFVEYLLKLFTIYIICMCVKMMRQIEKRSLHPLASSS